jgi:hypothetical protein
MIRQLGTRGWLAAILAVAALGGHQAARAGSAVPEAQLETFLGLSTGSGLNTGALTGLGNGPVMDGSAIMQTITVPAGGATLTFNADFLTNAPPPGANLLSALDPFAFYTKPTLTDFADNFTKYPSTVTNPPALTGLIPAPSETGYAYQTGYSRFSVPLAVGTYAIGFGVVDVTTDRYSSALLITDFNLSSGSITNGSFGTGDSSGWSTIGNTQVGTSSFGIASPSGTFQAIISTAVPEPSSLVLLVLGGAGAVVASRRRRDR